MLLDDPPPPPGSMIVAPPVFPAPPPPGGDDAPELLVALQATGADAARSRINLCVFEKISIEETLCPGVDKVVELHESLREQHGYQRHPDGKRAADDDVAKRSTHRRRRDTSGAARTNSLAAASRSIQRPIARYETGVQELAAPAQSADATGCSSLPLAFSPPRTRVHRSDAKDPRPSASTTDCCSLAHDQWYPASTRRNASGDSQACPATRSAGC